MQRMTAKALLAACLMALSSEWAAAQSGMASLRVRCDGDSAGAAVSINGQFKGECPFDAMVPEGTLKIDARKPTRNEYERVFEQEVRVGAGIIKSIEVVLGREQLTAEGKRALAEQAEAKRREEEARQADLQRQAAEVERQRAARFERLRNAADGGDVKVARVAIEQARAQRGLCLPNGSAECRLRHAHLQACAPKTARLHDVDEGLQLRQRKVDLAHAIDPFLLSHI